MGDNLKSGDLVFFSHNDPLCKSIRFLTRSKYCHIGMCLESPFDFTIISPIGPGHHSSTKIHMNELLFIESTINPNVSSLFNQTSIIKVDDAFNVNGNIFFWDFHNTHTSQNGNKKNQNSDGVLITRFNTHINLRKGDMIPIRKLSGFRNENQRIEFSRNVFYFVIKNCNKSYERSLQLLFAGFDSTNDSLVESPIDNDCCSDPICLFHWKNYLVSNCGIGIYRSNDSDDSDFKYESNYDRSTNTTIEISSTDCSQKIISTVEKKRQTIEDNHFHLTKSSNDITLLEGNKEMGYFCSELVVTILNECIPTNDISQNKSEMTTYISPESLSKVDFNEQLKIYNMNYSDIEVITL